MQENVVLLPSPNSAFTRMGRQRSERIPPSYSLRKRLLFGGNPSDRKDVKTEVNDIIKDNQSAFTQRWNCRCDVIVCCCNGSKFEPIRNSKIPKYNWSPIDKPLDDEEALLDDFQMKDVLDNRTSRPDAPVPFSPSHTRCNNSGSTISSNGSENDLTSDINPSSDPPTGCITPPTGCITPPSGCITPPSSPDNSDHDRKSSRNSQQSSETDSPVCAESKKESNHASPSGGFHENVQPDKNTPDRS